MVDLYVETNFLVGIAAGREPLSVAIASGGSPGISVLMPSTCVFEAYGWMEGENKRRNDLNRRMQEQIGELARDLTSPHAAALRSSLENGRVANKSLLLDVNQRLADAVDELQRRAVLINLDPATIAASRRTPYIEELTDNLILHCVLDHARTNPAKAKAFLSENANDFDQTAVRSVLQDAGLKYFRKARTFLEWAGANAGD